MPKKLSCAEPVLDALLCAQKYMAAREPSPMPDWLQLVEDAIATHRSRHLEMLELLEAAYDALPHGDITTRIAKVLAASRGDILNAAD